MFSIFVNHINNSKRYLALKRSVFEPGVFCPPTYQSSFRSSRDLHSSMPTITQQIYPPSSRSFPTFLPADWNHLGSHMPPINCCAHRTSRLTPHPQAAVQPALMTSRPGDSCPPHPAPPPQPHQKPSSSLPKYPSPWQSRLYSPNENGFRTPHDPLQP